MKRTAFVWSIVLGMILVGVVATRAPVAQVITKTEKFTVYGVEVEAVKTAQNFLVLFNTAKTMGRAYKNTGMRHIDVAKKLLRERNTLLPNLPYNAGLYTFAPMSTFYTRPPLKAYYPMQPYNRAKFATAIAQLPTEARGATEFQLALASLEPVLKTLSGKTIIFVFTDGRNTAVDVGVEGVDPSTSDPGSLGPNLARTPAELTRDLAQKYDICINIVSSATGELEQELLRAVASINECSRVLPIDAILGKPEYVAGSLFVMEDRVFEIIKTRQKVVGFNMDNILFGFNSFKINPQYHPGLQALGNFLQEHPRAYVLLAGFTDPVGSSEYNLQLSRRRVESVRHYLITNSNIASDRLVTLWYGALAPVAPNDTNEGRSQNRRVMSAVVGLSQ